MLQSKEREGGRFMFLAHWVENWNWLLKISDDLHNNPHHAWRWVWLWPVCAIVSVIYAIGPRAYNVVDRFTFNGGLKGETWLIRNFGWHFMVSAWRERICSRILTAVLDAQKQGFDAIGLGALTKAEWLTAGGKWIVEQLGDKLTTPIVHGDTMTASAVIVRIWGLVERYKIHDRPIFILGATSKIGRAVALMLAANGMQVKLHTSSRERFLAIFKEAMALGCSGNISQSTKFAEGSDCPLWITGKAKVTGKKLLRYIPQQAIVVNFSVPDPLSRGALRSRPDILHVDGGLVRYNLKRTDLRFTMRLTRGVTYACHAGTIIHAHEGWTHHEVGPVDLNALEPVWQTACQLGFDLPEMTSHLRPITAPIQPLPWTAQNAEDGAILRLEVAA